MYALRVYELRISLLGVGKGGEEGASGGQGRGPCTRLFWGGTGQLERMGIRLIQLILQGNANTKTPIAISKKVHHTLRLKGAYVDLLKDEKQGEQRKRAGGLALLTRVYEELYFQLGEDYSPAELLKAAQTLIDVTAEEYGFEEYSDSPVRDGYFSASTDRMIKNHSWLILERESRLYPGVER